MSREIELPRRFRAPAFSSVLEPIHRDDGVTIYTVLFTNPREGGHDALDIVVDRSNKAEGFHGSTVIAHHIEDVKQLGEGDFLVGARILAHSYRLGEPGKVSLPSRRFFSEDEY